MKEAVGDRQATPLLELDPELGILLEGERLAAARHELLVNIHLLEPGPWDVGRLSGAGPEHIGLLVLDGLLSRDVLVWDTVSTELLGAGDVIRPWRVQEGGSMVGHSVRWTVLAHTRVAFLDRRLSARLGRYPEVNAVIIDRVVERSLRLAVAQAISQLNRVDRRLLALFWHLAERWGRVTADGIAIPLTLSHRMLGQLVGARRQTVSTALAELARQGDLTRQDDGTWRLKGAPVGAPEREATEPVPLRRPVVPTGSEAMTAGL
jgi:CRP/FNR family cyclic AMP-dependent transcriptional regulator